MKNVGLGRIAKLKEPISINQIISKMKSLLNQKTFRLALANRKTQGIYWSTGISFPYSHAKLLI